jgi:type IV pilus assembly protein PilP
MFGRFLHLMIFFFLTNAVLGEAAALAEPPMPSEKNIQVQEGLPRLPQTVGRAVRGIGEKRKQSVQDAVTVKTVPKTTDEESPVAGTNTPQSDAPRISKDRRDPFRPLSLTRRANPRDHENLSPLERYELGQLKLVGIIWDAKAPRALVEDSLGLGYIVKTGTPIGVNDGRIKTIKQHAIVVEESYSDFYGTRKRREINIKMPSEQSE